MVHCRSLKFNACCFKVRTHISWVSAIHSRTGSSTKQGNEAGLSKPGLDTEAARQLVHGLGDDPTAAVTKHANPCRATKSDITVAYTKAQACDHISAFGGIVAINYALSATLGLPLVWADKHGGW